jgi:hypothetical protein|tara:strand:- start:119 stop:223 length:105 start_codon:yes stop_codon:yes gene_type:complete
MEDIDVAILLQLLMDERALLVGAQIEREVAPHED